MKIQRDKKGQPFIEWEQASGGYKRAWIQHKTDPGKDWAEAPGARYLNVVRVQRLGEGPAGNATDFPIFSDLSDEQILQAFVASVCAITGCKLS
jgi:hypothetical protein